MWHNELNNITRSWLKIIIVSDVIIYRNKTEALKKLTKQQRKATTWEEFSPFLVFMFIRDLRLLQPRTSVSDLWLKISSKADNQFTTMCWGWQYSFCCCFFLEDILSTTRSNRVLWFGTSSYIQSPMFAFLNYLLLTFTLLMLMKQWRWHLMLTVSPPLLIQVEF